VLAAWRITYSLRSRTKRASHLLDSHLLDEYTGRASDLSDLPNLSDEFRDEQNGTSQLPGVTIQTMAMAAAPVDT
jgi:hypothetical protein